ncbi:hypothetical protein EVJ58_g10979 [Rhodofomes roseus]|uniref:Uncharacterized protein n=1 Tax=Rhodofomes roseus TaxID=34475 RepID=A0A4Y9XK89_9APHY|nr:hypothetical protein EVJ58_g10979 [Rhodofomes roseus]
MLVPASLDDVSSSGVQPSRDLQPSTFVESPRPRPADNSSLTALPPGWSVRRSPPTTPSTADWFCPVEVSNSGIPVFVPQPVATSTPGRSNGPADNAVPNNPSVSADEVMLAAKEAVDKVHLKDLVDETGRFKIHLRKPAEAQAIFNDLNAQDALGNFSTLFEETNAFIAEDLDPRDIVDAAEFERKESRYRIKARAMLRINYVVEGLESLVNQILCLENAHRKWKTDHANSLMGALRGSASRGLLSDAFRVIQYRAAKAITLIHQRRALHDGANYPESVKSTASDFSQHIRSSNSKRMVIDKWLDHPDIFSNLTPEYQAVVLRRLGNAEGIDSELTNLQIPPDQRFKWPPSSMLVTPVVHGASVSMAESTAPPSRTSSAARVELDLTRALSSVPSEPSSPVKAGGVTQTPISHFLKRLKTREEGFNSKNLLILEEIRQLMMLDLPNPNRVLRSEDLPHPGREVTRSLSRNLRPPKQYATPSSRPLDSRPLCAHLQYLEPRRSSLDRALHNETLHPISLATTTSKRVSQLALTARGRSFTNLVLPVIRRMEEMSLLRRVFRINKTRSATTPALRVSHTQVTPAGEEKVPPLAALQDQVVLPEAEEMEEMEAEAEEEITETTVPPRGTLMDGDALMGFTAVRLEESLLVEEEVGLRLDQKISRNSIPGWDGSHKTVLIYLHKMNNLARKNDSIARDLGAAAPDKFTGRAERWWQLLDFPTQKLYSSDWWKLYEGIKLQFFTHKFEVSLRTQYDGQRFRQPGHDKELPMDFVDRRLLYHRHLTSALENPAFEIAAVMQNAPPTWSTVLSLDSIETIAALMSKVADKSDELIAFASMAPARTSQYEQLLHLPVSKPDSRNFSTARRTFAVDGLLGGRASDPDDEDDAPIALSTVNENAVPVVGNADTSREALALNTQSRTPASRPARGGNRRPPTGWSQVPSR